MLDFLITFVCIVAISIPCALLTIFYFATIRPIIGYYRTFKVFKRIVSVAELSHLTFDYDGLIYIKQLYVDVPPSDREFIESLTLDQFKYFGKLFNRKFSK